MPLVDPVESPARAGESEFFHFSSIAKAGPPGFGPGSQAFCTLYGVPQARILSRLYYGPFAERIFWLVRYKNENKRILFLLLEAFQEQKGCFKQNEDLFELRKASALRHGIQLSRLREDEAH